MLASARALQSCFVSDWAKWFMSFGRTYYQHNCSAGDQGRAGPATRAEQRGTPGDDQEPFGSRGDSDHKSTAIVERPILLASLAEPINEKQGRCALKVRANRVLEIAI